MAGLSQYYRSAPINPTMQSTAGLFWFLTSSGLLAYIYNK